MSTDTPYNFGASLPRSADVGRYGDSCKGGIKCPDNHLRFLRHLFTHFSLRRFTETPLMGLGDEVSPFFDALGIIADVDLAGITPDAFGDHPHHH